MVAMNAQTYVRDLQEVAPGGGLIYDYPDGDYGETIHGIVAGTMTLRNT